MRLFEVKTCRRMNSVGWTNEIVVVLVEAEKASEAIAKTPGAFLARPAPSDKGAAA